MTGYFFQPMYSEYLGGHWFRCLPLDTQARYSLGDPGLLHYLKFKQVHQKLGFNNASLAGRGNVSAMVVKEAGGGAIPGG